MIKLKINGREIEAERGLTVLEAAQSHGIKIPNLCAAPSLAPYGGCRLCLIEIKGRKGFAPACCTYVEDGLDIQTETPEIQALRRLTLQLILSEHPHACLICTEKKNCEDYKSTIRKVGEVTGCVLCPSNGRCRLQEVLEMIQIDRVNFPASYREIEIHREDPFFDRNYNLCILCGRCVRVCNEVRGASAISFAFRGPQAIIDTAFGRPLLDSGCQFCGACVDICPTGALTERATRGDLAPDDKRDTVCPLCSLGCLLEVELRKGRIISSVPKEGGPVNNGQACVKGRFLLRDVVGSPKRILKPLVRRNGVLQEANWEEALDLLSRKLKQYEGKDLAVLTSAQLSLEDLYVFYKFARDVLHTDNIDGSSHLSSLATVGTELLRQGVAPELNFELADVAKAKLIVLVETDLVVTHPLLWLEVLRAVGKGVRLVTIQSPETAPNRQASFSFKTRPEGFPAIFNSLSQMLLQMAPPNGQNGVKEQEILSESLARLNSSSSLSSSGIKDEDIRPVAHLLAEARPAAFLVGTSGPELPEAAAYAQALWNLALLSGARLILLAGENNERGALEIKRHFSGPGASFSQILSRSRQGLLKALYLAGRFSTLPPASVEFLVIQDSYMNENLKSASVVLPAATSAEGDGTFINVEGRIQKFSKLIEPLGEARPDWWIVGQLAQKMGAHGFPFRKSSEVLEELSRVMPVFEGISPRHQKKGKAGFVREEKKGEKRFLAAASNSPCPEGRSESPSGISQELGQDYYRSLNLREENKGLRRLREKWEAGKIKREE